MKRQRGTSSYSIVREQCLAQSAQQRPENTCSQRHRLPQWESKLSGGCKASCRGGTCRKHRMAYVPKHIAKCSYITLSCASVHLGWLQPAAASSKEPESTQPYRSFTEASSQANRRRYENSKLVSHGNNRRVVRTLFHNDWLAPHEHPELTTCTRKTAVLSAAERRIYTQIYHIPVHHSDVL